MPDENADAIHELVAEWLDRARSDLILAQMTEDERITPDILAFHAQQAAEMELLDPEKSHQVEPAETIQVPVFSLKKTA